MTCKEVISVVNSNQFLIGQRWVNKTNGEIETIIDLKAIELRKIENGWTIMVCFIPKIEGITTITREYFFDAFFNSFSKFE